MRNKILLLSVALAAIAIPVCSSTAQLKHDQKASTSNIIPKRADLWRKLVEIISKVLSVEASRITYESSFTNDLGADSLDAVELVMELEKEFNIWIPQEDAEKMVTVGKAYEYLKTVVAQK